MTTKTSVNNTRNRNFLRSISDYNYDQLGWRLNPCRSWGADPLECLCRSLLAPHKTMTLATPLAPGNLIRNQQCAVSIADQYEDTCFLCVQKYSEKLTCTMCCRTKVHTECATDLATVLSLLTYDHSLECGQLIGCNRLWVHACIINIILLNSYNKDNKYNNLILPQISVIYTSCLYNGNILGLK